MPNCCAIGCTNRSDRYRSKNLSPNNSKITFHYFPTDKLRRLEWIFAIGRKNFHPSKYSTVCSIHFRDEMIDRTMKRVVLHPNAVPTIFPASPSYLQKVYKEMETAFISKQEYANSFKQISNQISPTSGSLSRATQTDNKTLEDLQQTLDRNRKKIKVLQQSNRRMKKRIEKMNSVIRELGNKRNVDEDITKILSTIAGNDTTD